MFTKSESNIKYYTKNRTQIQKAREHMQCPYCKSVVCRSALPLHRKTKKCKFYFQLLSII